MNKLYLEQPLVVYYEQQYHPLLNRVMNSGSGRIQEWIQESGYTLVYFPGLWKPKGYNDPAITAGFRYYQPEYTDISPYNLFMARRMLSTPHLLQVLYKGLKEMLGNKNYPAAGFIIISKSGRVSVADFISHAEKAVENPKPERFLEEEILRYFQIHLKGTRISKLDSAGDTEEIMFAEGPVNFINREKAPPIVSDPEKEFEEESRKVSQDMLEEMQLNLAGEEGPVLLDLLIRIMEHIRVKDPELVKNLEKMLQLQLKPKENKLSRLHLMLTHGGYDYKILLPDYDLEVDMPQLPKALYLFFLRHPEGVFLHDLPDHREELRSIYGHIANISDLTVMDANIDRLTDMTDNSIHVNCARIKRAFLEKITDRLAQYYYVTGARGKAKKVTLPLILMDIDPELTNI